MAALAPNARARRRTYLVRGPPADAADGAAVQHPPVPLVGPGTGRRAISRGRTARARVEDDAQEAPRVAVLRILRVRSARDATPMPRVWSASGVRRGES